MATCNLDMLAVYPCRLFRGEEHGDLRNVVWLSDPPQRSSLQDDLGEVAISNPTLDRAFGSNETGIEAIDADFSCTQFLRERDRDRVDGSLRSAVNYAVRLSHLACC